MTMPSVFPPLPFLGELTRLQTWVAAHPAEFLAGSLSAMGLSVGARLAWQSLVRRQRGPLDTHGSARWARAGEIRRAGFLAPTGFVLGRYRGRMLHDNGTGHVLLVGPTGSGKDRDHLMRTTKASAVQPTATAPSLIVHDPKQLENWRLCGQARRGPAGQWPVYLFHPSSRDSCSVNILETVRVGEPEEFADVSLLVHSLLAPPKHTKDSTGARYYRLDEITLLRGVLLFVLHETSWPCFPAVVAAMGDRKQCVQRMKSHGHAEVRRVGQWFADKTESDQKDLWSGAGQPLDLYHDPLVAQHTAASSFALRDLQYGATPLTLYLGAQSTGQVHTYLAPLYRCILQALLEHLKVQPAEARRPLWWLLNEYPALGAMDVLEAAPADVRAYQMRLCYVIQDLGQFFEVSGPHTPIWGNTATKIFHRMANDQTAARLTTALGSHTVEYASQSTQRQLGSWRRTSTQTHRQRRELLDLAQLLQLSPQQALIWSLGCRPFLVKKG